MAGANGLVGFGRRLLLVNAVGECLQELSLGSMRSLAVMSNSQGQQDVVLLGSSDGSMAQCTVDMTRSTPLLVKPLLELTDGKAGPLFAFDKILALSSVAQLAKGLLLVLGCSANGLGQLLFTDLAAEANLSLFALSMTARTIQACSQVHIQNHFQADARTVAVCAGAEQSVLCILQEGDIAVQPAAIHVLDAGNVVLDMQLVPSNHVHKDHVMLSSRLHCCSSLLCVPSDGSPVSSGMIGICETEETIGWFVINGDVILQVTPSLLCVSSLKSKRSWQHRFDQMVVKPAAPFVAAQFAALLQDVLLVYSTNAILSIRLALGDILVGPGCIKEVNMEGTASAHSAVCSSIADNGSASYLASTQWDTLMVTVEGHGTSDKIRVVVDVSKEGIDGVIKHIALHALDASSSTLAIGLGGYLLCYIISESAYLVAKYDLGQSTVTSLTACGSGFLVHCSSTGSIFTLSWPGAAETPCLTPMLTNSPVSCAVSLLEDRIAFLSLDEQATSKLCIGHLVPHAGASIYSQAIQVAGNVRFSSLNSSGDRLVFLAESDQNHFLGGCLVSNKLQMLDSTDISGVLQSRSNYVVGMSLFPSCSLLPSGQQTVCHIFEAIPNALVIHALLLPAGRCVGRLHIPTNEHCHTGNVLSCGVVVDDEPLLVLLMSDGILRLVGWQVEANKSTATGKLSLALLMSLDVSRFSSVPMAVHGMISTADHIVLNLVSGKVVVIKASRHGLNKSARFELEVCLPSAAALLFSLLSQVLVDISLTVPVVGFRIQREHPGLPNLFHLLAYHEEELQLVTVSAEQQQPDEGEADATSAVTIIRYRPPLLLKNQKICQAVCLDSQSLLSVSCGTEPLVPERMDGQPAGANELIWSIATNSNGRLLLKV